MANKVSLFTASNFITGLRIAMAPFLYISLMNDAWIVSFLLCFLGGVTDFLDGAIARHFKQTSFFGEIFDPVADKVMVTFIYVAFYQKGIIPAIAFFTILGRDIFLILGSLLVLKTKRNIPLSPLILSKINTFFQFFLCAWIVCINAYQQIHPLSDIFNIFTDTIIYGTLVLTVLSGLQYAKRFILFFKK
ncbi:MAG: CDP-alcohol phosphatidyltransferase family protein [Proteobacteria bacterium]|nr:CDP-alcohol phosphatidyltransferase family protein [Pseudomonadota bacterium]